MYNALSFGDSLAEAFARESNASPFSEIQQFRALMRAFGALNGSFAVEEFHGAKHQVEFDGQGAWARSKARCELCDLAILSYSNDGWFRGRLTFLQAKLDTKLRPCDICMWCSGNQIEFQANLEQWDLLSRRPVISPVRPFTADPELLSGAALPSVGSFGVFHRGCCCRESGFFYVSADCLQPKGAPKTRSGKLVVNHGHPPMRHLQGFAERTYCEDVGSFGQALYELEIWTPLEKPGSQYQSDVCRWLGSIIANRPYFDRQDSEIANELLRIFWNTLESDDPLATYPDLLVIRSGPKESR